MSLRNAPQICMLGFLGGLCIHSSAKVVHANTAGAIVLGLLGLVALLLSLDVALGFPMISRISRRRSTELQEIRDAYAVELDRDAPPEVR